MDWDWQNILGLSAVIIAVGCVSLVGLMRERLKVLSDLNDDLDNRVAFLEKERAADEAEKIRMNAEIVRLQDREDALSSIVRDRANYTAISNQLDDVHRIVVGIDRKVTR